MVRAPTYCHTPAYIQPVGRTPALPLILRLPQSENDGGRLNFFGHNAPVFQSILPSGQLHPVQERPVADAILEERLFDQQRNHP